MKSLVLSAKEIRLLTLPENHPRVLRAAEKRLRRLKPKEHLRFANSYNRMSAILRLHREQHPDFTRLLGEHWSGCDNIGSWYRREVKRMLSCERHRAPLRDAMNAKTLRVYDALPEFFTIWRGCFPENRRGFSWSLSREIAQSFPYISRFSKPGRQPILLEARVAKRKILFVHLDRDESEVVILPEDRRVTAVHRLSIDEPGRVSELVGGVRENELELREGCETEV